MEYESDDYSCSNWYSWYSQERIDTSPGDLRGLAVTHTSVKTSANADVKKFQTVGKQKWEVKQLYGRFKRPINNMDLAKKRKL